MHQVLGQQVLDEQHPGEQGRGQQQEAHRDRPEQQRLQLGQRRQCAQPAVEPEVPRPGAHDVEAEHHLRAAVDLVGESARGDVPGASAVWLPIYETLDRTDSLYRRTVKAIPHDRSALVREIGRLLGPESEDVLQWLRRAPLHGGLAAEIVDENGVAVTNAGDAALSGLLAWTAWFAVHALGVAG